MIGRYAEVTAPALYGRPVNLYWDSRHVSAVAAMLARAASMWRLVLALIVAALVPVLIYIVLRWAIGRVAGAMRDPRAAPRARGSSPASPCCGSPASG